MRFWRRRPPWRRLGRRVGGLLFFFFSELFFGRSFFVFFSHELFFGVVLTFFFCFVFVFFWVVFLGGFDVFIVLVGGWWVLLVLFVRFFFLFCCLFVCLGLGIAPEKPMKLALERSLSAMCSSKTCVSGHWGHFLLIQPKLGACLFVFLFRCSLVPLWMEVFQQITDQSPRCSANYTSSGWFLSSGTGHVPGHECFSHSSLYGYGSHRTVVGTEEAGAVLATKRPENHPGFA